MIGLEINIATMTALEETKAKLSAIHDVCSENSDATKSGSCAGTCSSKCAGTCAENCGGSCDGLCVVM